MDIYLIRHTTPNVEKGTAYGQTDLDVVETFNQEMLAVRQALPEAFQEIPFLSSPLQRCRKLAEALEPKELKLEERIKEINMGDWEMKLWKDIEGEVMQRWMKNFTTTPTPNGESYEDLAARAYQVWDEIHQEKLEKIALVTHFGIIQSILSKVLHIPLEKSFRLQVEYGGVIHINWNEFSPKVRFLK